MKFETDRLLIDPKDTTSTFGVIQEEETLHIVSGCCWKKIEYVSYGGKDGAVGFSGSPDGTSLLRCPCGETYKGYINTSTTLDAVNVAYSWLEPWLGLKDVEVDIRWDE